MNNTHRFDGKGDIYAKARPKYAHALFDYMKNELNISDGSFFADIGSGTGIFAEQLLESGYRVYAVEPSADMRKKAEKKLNENENFVSVDGNASETHLPDRVFDCVTAAQAFHWFDTELFRKECARILKPNGRVIIVYNARIDTAECSRALAELHREFCPEFKGFSGGMGDEKCIGFFAGKCSIFRADNTQVYDKEGYINRSLSSSYSLKDGDERYEEYVAALGELFDRFSTDGLIAVPTETTAYIGEV